MKPLRDFILIETVGEQVSAGGIVLPDESKAGDLCAGVVKEIGPRINPIHENLNIGSKVYYLRETGLSESTSEQIVHISKIVAVEDKSHLVGGVPSPISDIDWNDYKTETYEDFWKELTNYKRFSFALKFLKPFIPPTTAKQEVYEVVVSEVANKLDIAGSQVELVEDEKNGQFICGIESDTLGGKFEFDAEVISLAFLKDDLQTIIEKLPHYMRAMSAITELPFFSRVLGDQFQRVTVAQFKFQQLIKLVGQGRKGKEPVSNKDVIQKLVSLGKSYHGGESVIDNLSPISNSAGRVDLTFSVDRQIDGHEYTIFIELQAPMNQDSSILWADVTIQDHNPGLLSQRDYTPIFVDFLRKSYFESFLKELFDGVYCTTLGSK